MRRLSLDAVAACCAAATLACGSKSEPAVDGPPVVVRSVVSPEQASPGGLVEIAVVAHDPEGGALGYTWQLSDGWTIVGSPWEQKVIVRAPERLDETGVASVTVSDPGGKLAHDVALVRTAPTPGTPAVTFRALLAEPNPVTPGRAIAVAPVAESADHSEVAYEYEVSDPAWILAATPGGARIEAPLAYERSATLTVSARGASGGVGIARMLLATEPAAVPRIEALVVTPELVSPGAAARLRALASSPLGLPLQYAWSVDGAGWTLSADGAIATATAPARPGESATVTLVVTDAAGGSASSVATVRTGEVQPASVSLVASATTVPPGGTVKLFASAGAGTSGPLGFAWSVDDPDWTLASSADLASLVAPLRYGRSAVVTVVLTDGAERSSAAHAIVTTAPYAPPEIESLVATPAAVAPGGTIRLAAVATSAEGLPLEYRWSVAGAGWDVTGSGAEAVVTAPYTPAESTIVSVDVADSAGASARATIAVATAP